MSSIFRYGCAVESSTITMRAPFNEDAHIVTIGSTVVDPICIDRSTVTTIHSRSKIVILIGVTEAHHSLASVLLC